MAIWHYIAAPFVFALLGLLWHLWRSIPLPLPDRLTDSPRVDSVHIPGGYRWSDFIYDTEFDEDGYYRLDSSKNLRVAIGLMVFFGVLLLVCVPNARTLFADVMDFCAHWLWERVQYRLANPW